jgi:hypothetical protein
MKLVIMMKTNPGDKWIGNRTIKKTEGNVETLIQTFTTTFDCLPDNKVRIRMTFAVDP